MIFSGCTEKTGTEIQTPEGKITVSEGTGAGPEWCPAGITETRDSGTLIIKGITTYKGRQVCQAEGKVTEAGGETSYYVNYYTEDFKYVVIIMKDSSGKVISENEVNNP